MMPTQRLLSRRAISTIHLTNLVSSAVILFIFIASYADGRYTIGVNYGQLGDNLLSPHEAVKLIKDMKVGKVKIYDANPPILHELRNSKIKVSVMLPNEQIIAVGMNKSVANDFVRTNISGFYGDTKIRTLLVGNEILSGSNETWPYLVPAMINLHHALREQKLRKVKVSTPLAMNLFQASVFPPSKAAFRTDLVDSVLKPMLKFLARTRSSVFIDVYPFFEWGANPSNISLDFALFDPSAPKYKDENGLEYENLLDVQLDALVSAMAKVGYPDARITISETGWPSKMDLDQKGADIPNAAIFNRRLVKKMLARPPLGTPLRKAKVIDTYIFALFNENLKPGPTTERNFGLLYPNGTHVYDIDLTGNKNESEYEPLPPVPPEAAPGSLKLWCIANPQIDMGALGAALSYACGEGSADCAPIQPGGSCFFPNNTVSHASYAFNDYYNKFHKIGGTCVFAGAADLTTVDPSKPMFC
ncbi:hypothetical protein KP509_31G062400 [Ceratopteris richardii]|uniref:glucan endo-1,3-beta-D-glucosidase n=1 Tax=Ceratopteris richardii TaxID=49495 RepID=A0A8T2QYW2_CERRI|nr:hypothetical protein KP509_31G062400 [Ceratopteris richardii]